MLAVCATGGYLFSREKEPSVSDRLPLPGQVFKLEVADTEAERVHGLSDRTFLKDNAAMLFVFSEPSQQCIWMKDMHFSLDIVWLDSTKKITKIAEHITPDTYPQAFCMDDTKYVLEFKADIAKEHRLKVGQNLNF